MMGGGGGLNAGDKMSIIGGAVTSIGQLWEGYWGHEKNKQLARQLKYDTKTQWDFLQRSAANEEKDRIYNANIERTVNALARGQFNARIGQGGVRGQTISLLQSTQAAAQEADVQEKSRQSRNRIKDIEWESVMLMKKSRYARKQLQMEGNLALQNGIISSFSSSYQIVSGIANQKGSQSGGSGGGGGSSVSGSDVASMVSAFKGKGK